MVIVDDGLEKTASNFASDLTNGAWGDDNTLPSSSDTALISEIAATDALLTSVIVSGNSVEFTHDVDATTGNGESLIEYGLFFGDDTMLSRTVGSTISKSSSVEVSTLSVISFVRI